jgi:hypothetical protein
VNDSGTDQPNESGWYEIRLQGRLDPRWSALLDDMTLTSDPDGTTVIRGPVVDQPALHGLLARLRDIGLPLLSVAQVEPDRAQATDHPSGHTDPGD